tara:strand:+ start:377 stop:670 length:294 start_codon:yes stop_codon:yes gene_type:complete
MYVYMPLSPEEREKKAQILAENQNWPMSDISEVDRSRIVARAEQIRRERAATAPQSGGTKKTKKRVHKKHKKSKKHKKHKKSKKKSKTKKVKKLKKN